MRSLSTMQTNVSNFIQDTSTAMKALIKVWLNDAYRIAWDSCLWSVSVNDNYTFESVANTAEYNLPGDFGEEIYVANIADGVDLKRMTIGEWWRERHSAYQADSITSGTPSRYVILSEDVGTSYYKTGQIKLDPPPDAVNTYAMPYKRRFTPMTSTTGTCTTDTASKIIASASTFITDSIEPGMIVKNTADKPYTYSYISSVDSETQLTIEEDICPDGDETFAINPEPLIEGIEDYLEKYAISKSLQYKRQYAKATMLINEAQEALARRVSRERSKVNQRYQFVPAGYKLRGGVYRLTGNTSYDTV